MSEPIEQRIQIALDKVRPYLQEDGGDVELVRMRDDGILEVSLTGTCKRCPMSLMTLRAGVERAVMKDIPEIRRVETV
ncbi:MAG: NifU family protein [Ignavibacteriae bacterium]|nr:NifU family protein [Ignavibacteriota bacterium]